MRKLSKKTRWIIALLLLSLASRVLTFAPQLDNASTVAWGLSFAFLIAALVLAVMRLRDQRSSRQVPGPEDEGRPHGR